MSPILYRDRGKEGKREKYAVTGGGELFWMSGIDTRVRWSAIYRYKQCLQPSSQSKSHLWAGWAALAPSKAGRMVQGPVRSYGTVFQVDRPNISLSGPVNKFLPLYQHWPSNYQS